MSFSGFRTEVDTKAIERLAGASVVLDELDDVAEKIERNVKTETSRSRTLRPYGRKMSRERVGSGKKTRIRVGTSWGPAVPVEYGTIRTPAKRILLTAAEREGRVSFG